MSAQLPEHVLALLGGAPPRETPAPRETPVSAPASEDPWLRRLAHLEAQEDALVALGWAPAGDFWRDVWRAALRGHVRTVVVRVGRRGGKSSRTCRFAVSECTAGVHEIPAGDVPIYPMLSRDRQQAKDRVDTCVAICEALGIPHKATATEIRFPDHGTMIRVTTASVGAAVSATALGGLCDEMAHWKDDTGANPAKQILSALRPSMVTMPGAILWMPSAPWTTSDPHAQEYDRSETDRRMRVHAPSWVANPTLTEEGCREEAEDEIDFLRNYAAVPCDIDGAMFFDPSLVDGMLGAQR